MWDRSIYISVVRDLEKLNLFYNLYIIHVTHSLHFYTSTHYYTTPNIFIYIKGTFLNTCIKGTILDTSVEGTFLNTCIKGTDNVILRNLPFKMSNFKACH